MLVVKIPRRRLDDRWRIIMRLRVLRRGLGHDRAVMIRRLILIVPGSRNAVLPRLSDRRLGHDRAVVVWRLVLIIPRLHTPVRWRGLAAWSGMIPVVKGRAGLRRIGRGDARPVVWLAARRAVPRLSLGNAQLAHGNRMDRRPRRVGDVPHRDAVVDIGPVVPVEIEVIDDGGLMVNPWFIPVAHAIVARMRIAKIAGRHKRKAVDGQAKIEVNAHASAVIKEPRAGPVNRKRG